MGEEKVNLIWMTILLSLCKYNNCIYLYPHWNLVKYIELKTVLNRYLFIIIYKSEKKYSWVSEDKTCKYFIHLYFYSFTF